MRKKFKPKKRKLREHTTDPYSVVTVNEKIK